jgi:hypothetical protein
VQVRDSAICRAFRDKNKRTLVTGFSAAVVKNEFVFSLQTTYNGRVGTNSDVGQDVSKSCNRVLQIREHNGENEFINMEASTGKQWEIPESARYYA